MCNHNVKKSFELYQVVDSIVSTQNLQTMEKAILPVHAQASSGPKEVAAVGLAQAQDRHMSIRAEDSGITTIPHVTLDALWVKAEQILQSGNAITPAPGENKKARMLLS